MACDTPAALGNHCVASHAEAVPAPALPAQVQETLARESEVSPIARDSQIEVGHRHDASVKLWIPKHFSTRRLRLFQLPPSAI